MCNGIEGEVTGNRWDLKDFQGAGYDKGRPVAVQAIWFAILNMVFRKWWCPAVLRVLILRIFGAEVGTNVLIRHDVRVLWPWKLRIGDSTWIGEGVWILNLEPVSIGSNVCVSQEVRLITGSHDRSSPSFEYDNASINIHNSVWVATGALVLRGVTINRGATIGARAVVAADVERSVVVCAGKSHTQHRAS